VLLVVLNSEKEEYPTFRISAGICKAGPSGPSMPL